MPELKSKLREASVGPPDHRQRLSQVTSPPSADTLSLDYLRWTGGRAVPSLGTNDGAPPLAFQSWHRFKEAFAPELIAKAIEDSELNVKRCIDPFGGSGTTTLACQMLGVSSTTIEVNPFLADVIRAKLHHYDVDELIRSLAHVRHVGRRRLVSASEYFKTVPRSFLPPGLKDRWLFNSEAADRLASLLSAIDDVTEPTTRRLFRVIVGGLLAEVSNVIVSGKGRRYRSNWQTISRNPEQVDALFSTRAERALLDIKNFELRPRPSVTIIEGDARTVPIEGLFDLCVFSPPYPNSFDYTDVYNLELWMLGYLKQNVDNKDLRNATLSSHVQLLRPYQVAPTGSATLSQAIEQLERAKGELWSPWIPSMIGSYFQDLLTVLGRVQAVLAPNAQCWMVVGDSRYRGVTVPVAKILCELVQSRGWSVRHSEPIRHMKSSAQQGWVPELAESLIVLQR